MMEAKSDGWDHDSVMSVEIEEEGPPPIFHYLNKLPRDIGTMIWEQVIDEDVKFDTWNFLAVRESSRALAEEAMPTFCRRATFVLDPERDESYRLEGIGFSAFFVSQIKNLRIDLSKMRYHKFHQSSWHPATECHETIYLVDTHNLLGIMASQIDCRRRECVLRADFDGETFKISDPLMRNLECLKTFEKVVFQGSWEHPNDSDFEKAAEKPFDDFKDKLEQIMGPAEICNEPGPFSNFQFHPRRYRATEISDRVEESDSKHDEMEIDD